MSSRSLWLLAFVGFCLLHAGWALAAPYDGPPDEQAHVHRAAGVMNGEIVAREAPRGAYQDVPLSLDTGLCFPQKVTVAADCSRQPGGDEDTEKTVGTTAGRYNPVYYLVTAWPVGVWPNWHGIVLSRLLNGAAMAALLACAVVVAARWTRHRAMVAGVVVAATPMIAHLGGAVNPNGVEIAAGVSLFAALVAVVHEQRQGVNRAAVALAGVSAAVMVTPRFIGIMWLFVILGVVLVPSSRARLRELVKSPAVRGWSALVVVAAVASVAWTLLIGTADLSGADRGWAVKDVLRAAFLDTWPNMANQMVGVMGWAETLMPRLVYVVWFMAVGLLLLGGFAFGGRVDKWRTLVLFLGTAVPLTAMELITVNTTGWFNQGRYYLTGAVAIPMLGALIMGKHVLTGPQTRTMTRMLAVLLLPVQLVCLAYTMTRWQSGLQSVNPFNGSWMPPYGPLLPLVAATLGVLVLLVMYWRASRVEVGAGPEREQAPQELATTAA
ncbi:DUF2142 domain-containing protein [Saccharothrix sp. HUAS TT1]|uniref:DUF2142 domain-containing protein n=1 Tax=unclassified Saccharothrix TaxID=2593673 RepID=UPI00345BAE1B